MASSSVHGQEAQAGEYQLLHEAFVKYSGLLRQCQADEATKEGLQALSMELQAQGVHGAAAVQMLQRHSARINWHGMHPDLFAAFYRFVYFICREPGKRNVQAHTAVGAWQLLLRGRFRLLDRFCQFVAGEEQQRPARVMLVLEDTWRQVLDFSRTVHEDLSNYDPAAAWPVLLDEFVEHQRRGGSSGRGSAEPMLGVLDPWGSGRSLCAPVSPRSGSKRRLPDIHEVAQALQQLPLGSSHGSGSATTTTSSGGGSGAPPPPPQQRQLQSAAGALRASAAAAAASREEEADSATRAAIKRYRVSRPAWTAPAAAPAQGGMCGSGNDARAPGGGANLGAAHLAGAACVGAYQGQHQQPHQQQHHHLAATLQQPQQVGSNNAVCAAGGHCDAPMGCCEDDGDDACGTPAGLPASAASARLPRMACGGSASPHCGGEAHAAAGPGVQHFNPHHAQTVSQQQQQPVAFPALQPVCCAAPGYQAGSFQASGAGVNAMMQVTVTDALGFR